MVIVTLFTTSLKHFAMHEPEHGVTELSLVSVTAPHTFSVPLKAVWKVKDIYVPYPKRIDKTKRSLLFPLGILTSLPLRKAK